MVGLLVGLYDGGKLVRRKSCGRHGRIDDVHGVVVVVVPVLAVLGMCVGWVPSVRVG